MLRLIQILSMTNILEITDESGFIGQSYTATSQRKKQNMHEEEEEEDARRCTKMQKKKKQKTQEA